MGFPKSLMTSAVLSGVVFCSATVPLAALNSNTVTVQVNEQPVLMGQIQDFAPPYLGFATLLSLGTGIVSLSALGWRQSAKKLDSTTDRAKSLEQKLQEQAYAIENLKFSDRRLIASGLDTFLTAEEQAKNAVQAESLAPQNTTVTQSNGSVGRNVPSGLSDESLEPVTSFIYGKTASGGEMSSVFKMPGEDMLPPAEDADVKAESASVPQFQSASADHDEEQLQALMGQLQQMMSQLEQLRTAQPSAQSAA